MANTAWKKLRARGARGKLMPEALVRLETNLRVSYHYHLIVLTLYDEVRYKAKQLQLLTLHPFSF